MKYMCMSVYMSVCDKMKEDERDISKERINKTN